MAKTFGIYIPSYKRSDTILTQNLLEYCTYVVRKSEEQAYKDAGVKNIIAVDDELINSGFKVYEWILNNTEEDVICTIDDDIKDMVYRLDTNENLNQDAELITSEVERIAQLIVDLDIGMACIDATSVPYGYDAEFAFKGISGAIRWINKSVFKAQMDKNVEFNFDNDLILQELLHNRIILKPKYLCSIVGIDTNAGGSSGKKRKDQINSIENMKLKWGQYFKYNYKKNVPNILVKR